MGGSVQSEVSELSFVGIGDKRGELVALESNKNVPFDIKRVYYMYQISKGAERGFHAHIKLKQVAVCVSGSCTIEVEYVDGKSSFLLDSPDKGIYMSGLVWREIKNCSDDCVLMVLADELYSEDDYIRQYSEFKQHLPQLNVSVENGD